MKARACRESIERRASRESIGIGVARKEAIMFRKLRTFALTALYAFAYCQLALGQAAPATILDIELENYVTYFNDITDYSRLATDSNRTTVTQPRNFSRAIGIADIVSVNGKPAKGVMTEQRTQFNLRVNPTPGQAMADLERNNRLERYYEILKPDGTQIGSLMAIGNGGGTPPPGAPLATSDANFVISGGTGAFLGARGQESSPSNAGLPGPRNASMTEDPANRRVHGGGRRHFILHVIPISLPEVVMTSTGPAVVHANDFSLVTVTRPARSGETLSLIATGLGPTRPGVDPGRPFTSDPLQIVNSPVEVIVNGTPVEFLYAGGYPGTTNTYQVNFRLPSGMTPGTARLQVSTAWVAGPEVTIPVQQ
jgi:hypothetical protein